MDLLAEKVGVDGYDIRDAQYPESRRRLRHRPDHARKRAGMRRSLEAVKDIYKNAKYAGIGCGIKSTGIGNGTIDSGHVKIRVLEGGRASRFSPATRKWARGCYTTIRQAVCEETGLPPEIMTSPLG